MHVRSTSIQRSMFSSLPKDQHHSSSTGNTITNHVAKVLNGREHVASFQGRSQYGTEGGGVAACGLAALNCARVVLGKERDGVLGEQILSDLMKQETAEEILRICLGWSNSHHLDVDDLYQAPIFRKNLRLVWQEYQRPGFAEFQDLLGRLQSTCSKATVAVITRPPEIICIIKVPCQGTDVFVIFDSHPRTKHPDGAGLIFNTSPSATARYLSDLLKFDPGLLEDPSLQWQAQLLANYSAHMFISDDSFRSLSDLMEAVLESSLSTLTLKAEVERLEGKNRLLEMETQRLSMDVDRLEKDANERKHRNRKDKGKALERPRSSVPTSGDAWKTVKSSSRSNRARSLVTSSTPSSSQRSGARVYHSGSPIPEDSAIDALVAAQAQREYEEEHAFLRAQAESLLSEVPKTFHCGICLEDENEYMVARFESCKHPFCRDCVRDYIRSKLGENRFPILCPSCATEKDHECAGTLDNSLVLNIGLTEDEHQTFSELQISTFSILLHCRSCKGSAFVDRQEYQDAGILQCPLPKCSYLWCKHCSQTVQLGGPSHSCDGSSELSDLMSARGWKFCPGCKTPTEKSDGCNHIACMSPGCNTHFCYVCGKSIVRSVRRTDIQRNVSAHYQRCALFEDVPDSNRHAQQ